MFLGPSAENAEALERLLRQALAAHVDWRKRLHPERDNPQPSPPSADEVHLSHELAALLWQLRGSVPFFSPRHLGHMASDVTLASLAGYVAGLLYNPNNVSAEGAPITARLEQEAIAQLARMFGYAPERHWGHLTSGGTSANLEALWAARAAKYLPVSLAWTLEDERLPPVEVELTSGERALLSELELRDLLNLPLGSALDAAARVREELGRAGLEETRMTRHFASELGMRPFAQLVEARFGQPLPEEVVLAPASAHYSWEKSCRVLGVGAAQLHKVPVDERFRMDAYALAHELFRLTRKGKLVLECIPVIGTTEHSAVDPLRDIVDLRKGLGRDLGIWFWLHADAAWGGYAVSAVRDPLDALGAPVPARGKRTWPAKEVAESFQALSEVESITVDPHKFGYAPFPAGALCFSDRRVRSLLTADAPYAFAAAGEHEESTGHYTLEGSRPGAAAAAVWLSQQCLPLDRTGHGKLIAASAAGARRLHELLTAEDFSPFRVAVLPAPDLHIVCFAVAHPSLRSLEATNAFGLRLFEGLSYPHDHAAPPPQYVVSHTLLRASTYGAAALRVAEALGFDDGDYQRAGGVYVLRSTVMHPVHAESDEYLRGFLRHLRELMGRALDEHHGQAQRAAG